jgi:hypothetical protein
MSTIILGKCVSQESKPKERNLYGQLQQFWTINALHE